MTREEAIQALKDLADMNVRYGCDDKWITALQMAIEALSANATVAKIQIDDIDKAKTSSQLLDDLAVDMVNAMGKRIVEVVRCKDCRFSEIFQNDSSGVMAMYCRAFTFERMVAEDDYCSYGERQCNYFGERREE